MPWIEPLPRVACAGYETIVVDNGSTDDTLDARARALPGGARRRAGEPRPRRRLERGDRARRSRALVFLLNADAWVVDDAVEQLARVPRAHPQAALVGPLLRNPDGSLQRSVRGFPTLLAARDGVPVPAQARAALARR